MKVLWWGKPHKRIVVWSAVSHQARSLINSGPLDSRSHGRARIKRSSEPLAETKAQGYEHEAQGETNQVAVELYH